MLKRLAFTVFCSEPDQYQKSTPEIQGNITEMTSADNLCKQFRPRSGPLFC